jgi:hypothetical protein
VDYVVEIEVGERALDTDKNMDTMVFAVHQWFG